MDDLKEALARIAVLEAQLRQALVCYDAAVDRIAELVSEVRDQNMRRQPLGSSRTRS